MDVLELDLSNTVIWSISEGRGRVDGWYAIDSLVDLLSRCECIGDCLEVWCCHCHGEGTDEDGEEDIDDGSSIGLALEDEGGTIVERQ